MESEIGTRQKNLIDARQKLIDAGLIRYEKGSTRDAGVYQLLSDGVTKESNQESNPEDNFPDVDQKDGQKKVIRGTLTKQDKTKQEESITSLPPKLDKEIEEILELYHRSSSSLPKVIKITNQRKTAIGARLKEHGIDQIKKMLSNVSESDFLQGMNKNNWTADFDWLFKPQNFLKVLEGNYKNKTNGNKQQNDKRAATRPATKDELAQDTGW
ncbi:MAG: hypothetical protein WAO52_18995 [Prolixibacteraceae bacterium]